MAEALQPVLEKHKAKYRRWATPTASTRFGDSQLRVGSVKWKMLGRALVSLPISMLGLVLCMTMIGIPLGFPVLLWVGGYISKPMRQLPKFNTNPTGDASA